MHKHMAAKLKGLGARKRVAALTLTVFAVLAVTALIVQVVTPKRSVVAYCEAYGEENAKLANAQGDTYSTSVFTHKSSNPGDFAAAFGKLEQVAPDEIRPDIETLGQVFQKIDNDPSQAISTSLSGLPAEASVKSWTTDHCGS